MNAGAVDGFDAAGLKLTTDQRVVPVDRELSCICFEIDCGIVGAVEIDRVDRSGFCETIAVIGGNKFVS